MSLNDRDALAVLHAAIDPDDENGLIGRFYSRWFSLDCRCATCSRPTWPRQRAAFAHALNWVYGELVAQRAEEPVTFLAQLGRDHRKYGVLPEHYETLRQALYATLRDELAEDWTDAVDAAAQQSLNLIIGVMGGAADADQGPAWWRRRDRAPAGIPQLAVIRLQLDRPMSYHAGQYVNVAVPQCPRRWRYLTPAIPPDDSGAIEFHVRAVSGGMVAMPSSTRPSPVTSGGCPARTAACRSTAMVATC